MNIFLIGPMAAGKSTIGKALAKTLKLQFFDSDAEIEKRCGADIAWIFDVEGEQGFRQRETAILDELTNKKGIVLATGGGVVLASGNRSMLGGRGIVIYLQASVEQQLARTEKDKKRPLLQTDNPRLRLESLHKQRSPLYEELADIILRTNSHSIHSVVSDIVKQLDDLKGK